MKMKLLAACAAGASLAAALTWSAAAQFSGNIPAYNYVFFQDGVQVGAGQDVCQPGPFTYIQVWQGIETADFERWQFASCTPDGMLIYEPA